MTLRLNGSASGYTELEAAPVAGNNKITFPASSGSSGQILKNSNGVLDWSQIRENADGSISLVAGTAAAPSLSFTGDLNTGIYSPGADQVAISTGGSGRLFVDASGNIGIGVSSPQEIIHASGNIRLVNGAGFASANSLISKIGSFAGSANQFDVVQIGFLTGSFSDQGQITFSTNNSSGIAERMRITQAGLVGIGTSSPSYKLDVQGGVISAGNGTIYGGIGYSTRPEIGSLSNHDCGFMTNSTTRMLLDTSGRLGIGTTSLNAKLVVSTNNENFEFSPATTTFNGGVLEYLNRNTNTTRPDLNYYLGSTTGGSHKFWTDGTERARIDSSGRLLVGTSDGSGGVSKLVVQGASNGSAVGVAQISYNGLASAGLGAGTDIGYLRFTDQSSNSGVFAQITATADATSGANDYPGRLVFSTTADGASSPTERMRITSDGTVFIGKTVNDFTTEGVQIRQGNATTAFVTGGGTVVTFSRTTNDGTIVSLRQDGIEEGTISVSGTTVSYNGAHLSRWSQLPSGAERTEILRGTVLSNIDEMCEWGEEDNEQLNRMKVSDVEGDKNVSGVFQAWDDDDDTYTNDFYCAMTGDFIIRIAQGVTVERGDLLMSAGDGTAKPQDDDIIRSKTIAKVTSTNVSCTYGDGSYCVPCVLMAC
jgi:hypothetical protein